MTRKLLVTLAASIWVAGCSTLAGPSGEGTEVAVVIEARGSLTTTGEILRDLGSGTSVIAKRM